MVAAILEHFDRPTVADLGAGTGISSRLLAQSGATVFAVEPNASMRAQIAPNPGITPVDGTAEASSLAAASVDIVTAFQAYHWFDPEKTFDEVERIARPRSRFAGVWNERDERDPFMREYGALIRPYMSDATEARRAASRTLLSDLQRRRWAHARVVERQYVVPADWEGLIGRTRSASYLPREGPAYEAMAEELRALFEHAGEYGGARFVMVTSAYLAERQ